MPPSAVVYRPLLVIRLVISELADLAGQLIEVEPGAVTLHLDRATLFNVAAQIKDALFGSRP